MKAHQKSDKVREPLAKEGRSKVGKVDELEVQRGQNGEKGNTLNPRHLRDSKEASH